ncbi:unnamed protein product [Adineta ricciae]|uniref:Uncharacterized protein n=1 Tax=Adineta ricciae TaxID=249248 RepID=A0A816H3N9_ADIRI|nr:unnamed protein product [Adineta ricciae]
MVLEVRYGTSDGFVKGEMVRKVWYGTQEGSASEMRNLSHPSDVRKGLVSLIRNPTWFRKSVSKPLCALRNYGRFCTRNTKPKKFSIRAAEPFNGLAITARNLFSPQNLKKFFIYATEPFWWCQT